MSAKYRLDQLGTIGDNTYHFWKFAPIHVQSKAENKQLETAGVVKCMVTSVWSGYLVLKFHIRFANIECKNAFLHAMRQWRHFDKGYITGNILERYTVELPERRCGYYKLSSHHADFGNCTYDGCWLYGKPHGRGYLVYPDKREYQGHFIDGCLEGFGKMSIPAGRNLRKINTYLGIAEERSGFDIYTGFWRNGRLDGPVHITFSNGDTYEGYMEKGLRHGYSVLHASKVSTSNKERYLGMWMNNSRHGKGTLLSINGVFQEGQFDKNRLVHDRLILSAADNYCGVNFEGDTLSESI
ncbi:ALS2 C-terminal-like protein [Dirofilaria immitis]